MNPTFFDHGASHGSILGLTRALEALQLIDLSSLASVGRRSGILAIHGVEGRHLVPRILVLYDGHVSLLLDLFWNKLMVLSEIRSHCRVDLCSICLEKPSILFVEEDHPVKLVLLTVDDSVSNLVFKEHQVAFE
jgi:hypothetical protein